MQWLRLPSLVAVARSTATRCATASKLSWPANGGKSAVRHLWRTCSRRSSGGASQAKEARSPMQQQQEFRFTPRGTEWKETPVRGLDQIAAFLASRAGKTVMRVVGVASFIGSLRIFILPQLFGMETYVNFYETADCAAISSVNHKTYKAEAVDMFMVKPRYCSDRLEKLQEEVLTDLSLPTRQSDSLRLFVCDHWLPRTVGSMNSRYGAALGMPVYFQWSDVADVSLDKVVHKPIYNRLFQGGTKLELVDDALDSLLAALKETLVLSDKAKKFALAWCTLKLDTNQHFWEMSPPFVFFMVLLCSVAAAHKGQAKLMKVPLARYAMYASLAAISLLFTMSVLASHRQELDTYCDDRSVELGTDYIEGAVEYFDKMAARGKLLRSLQKYGDYYFDEKGDLIPYWYQLRTTKSAEERRDYFKECLRKKVANSEAEGCQ